MSDIEVIVIDDETVSNDKSTDRPGKQEIEVDSEDIEIFPSTSSIRDHDKEESVQKKSEEIEIDSMANENFPSTSNFPLRVNEETHKIESRKIKIDRREIESLSQSDRIQLKSICTKILSCKPPTSINDDEMVASTSSSQNIANAANLHNSNDESVNYNPASPPNDELNHFNPTSPSHEIDSSLRENTTSTTPTIEQSSSMTSASPQHSYSISSTSSNRHDADDENSDSDQTLDNNENLIPNNHRFRIVHKYYTTELRELDYLKNIYQIIDLADDYGFKPYSNDMWQEMRDTILRQVNRKDKALKYLRQMLSGQPVQTSRDLRHRCASKFADMIFQLPGGFQLDGDLMILYRGKAIFPRSRSQWDDWKLYQDFIDLENNDSPLQNKIVATKRKRD
jgi:hypothetical protein